MTGCRKKNEADALLYIGHNLQPVSSIVALAHVRWSVGMQGLFNSYVGCMVQTHSRHLHFQPGETSTACVQEANARHWLIRAYYSNRIFMGFCCISCEVLYLCTFSMCHPMPPKWSQPAPASLQYAATVISSCRPSTAADLLPVVLQFVALPGLVVKQIVNVYQLLEAARKLIELEQKQM
jgi:hypothetical protein